MADSYQVDAFTFQNKEEYERAVREEQVVSTLRRKFSRSDVKTVWKVYVKSVEENVFTTAVGYGFLLELRQIITASGKIPENKIPAIPVRNDSGAAAPPPSSIKSAGSGDSGRYKRLYEGQRLLNKRLKIVLFAVFVTVAALLIIDFKSEYSVFTYFTDYKAKMEEELIDKYEKWEKELTARENALKGDQ